MSIISHCERCGHRHQFVDELAGRRTRCQACGHVFRVVASSSATEYSEGGIPIHRHGRRQKSFEPATGDGAAIEAISSHIQRHLGEVTAVFHELVSDLVHIDVHLIAPNEERPYHTLVTSGMSDQPMTVPPGAEEFRHAELLLSLPADWPLTQEAFADERNYWPIRWLKILARLPHEYDTWLGWGHTVPNNDPPEPFAPNTKLCGALLLEPFLVPEDFLHLTTADGHTIRFYALVPVYREEMDFKLKHGTDALIERLVENQVTELLDVRRSNLCQAGK